MRLIKWLCLLVALAGCAYAGDVPVPSRCTPDVNRGLQELIRSHTRRDVDNIMACGVASQHSQVRRGGPHGSHHVISIGVDLPDDGHVEIQVVINDSLDGAVSARAGDPVFAYGQGYIAHGRWVAGIHDVHCSTHPGANNGWVVVAGQKTPATCP